MANFISTHLLRSYLILSLFSWSVIILAIDNSKMAGKVIILRGKVAAKKKGDSKIYHLKKGDWLEEGTTVETAKRSFAKIIFNDKSTINIGPKSQMVISSFPNKKSGIITLIKGHIRSEVNKDLRAPSEKNNKSKFFVKTKTAAMGVRGTMWDATYNSKNKNTTVITFRGQVAMAKLNHVITTRKGLDALLNSKNSVMIRKGQFSTVSKKNTRATIPVKLSPTQFESLKKNDNFGINNKIKKNEPVAPSKKLQKKRELIPPGVNQKDFLNVSNEVDKQIEKSVGKSTALEIKNDLSRSPASLETTPPKGNFNKNTGAYAPPAGGIIDLKTGIYIKPPANSKYDPNSETYILPKKFGEVNLATGDYQPPEAEGGKLKLQANGEFVFIKDKKEENKNGRTPASSKGKKIVKSAPIIKLGTNIPDSISIDTNKVGDKTSILNFSRPTFVPPVITPRPIITPPTFIRQDIIRPNKGKVIFKVKPPQVPATGGTP